MRALRTALVIGALAIGSTALAQDTTTGDRATSFQAVTGSAHEDVPGGQLLVIAYAAVLTLVAAYVGRIAMMQRASAVEIARLSTILDAKTASDTQRDSAKKD